MTEAPRGVIIAQAAGLCIELKENDVGFEKMVRDARA